MTHDPYYPAHSGEQTPTDEEIDHAEALSRIGQLERQLEVERRAFDTLADHSVEQSEALGRAFRERDAARAEATEWRRVANGAASTSWLPPFEADQLRKDIERIRGERDHFRQQLDARADDVEALIAEAVRQEREACAALAEEMNCCENAGCEESCFLLAQRGRRIGYEIRARSEKPASGGVAPTAGSLDSRPPTLAVGTTSPSPEPAALENWLASQAQPNFLAAAERAFPESRAMNAEERATYGKVLAKHLTPIVELPPGSVAVSLETLRKVRDYIERARNDYSYEAEEKTGIHGQYGAEWRDRGTGLLALLPDPKPEVTK